MRSMTYPSRGEQAIEQARLQSEHGPRFAVGMCLKEVRECYGVAPLYTDAATAWAKAPEKHTDHVPPRGVPVYWTGGSGDHGHIAISTGDGFIWSTDSRRDGYFDRVPLSAPRVDWGLTYAGWSPYINGERVYLDPWLRPEDLPRNFRRADRALARAAKEAGTEARRALARRLRRILRREWS